MPHNNDNDEELPQSQRQKQRSNPKSQSRRDNNNGGRGGQDRQTLISKSLSRLLRHSAIQDRVPIDGRGYVRLDHVLQWGKLKGMNVTVGEILGDAEDGNEGVVGGSEKMRFGVLYAPTEGGEFNGERRGGGSEGDDEVQKLGVRNEREDVDGDVELGRLGKDHVVRQHQDAIEETENQGDVEVAKPTDHPKEQQKQDDGQEEISVDEEKKIKSQTQHALSIFQSGTDTDPRHFYIRANQGHSMKIVQAEELLVEVTFDSFSTSAATTGIAAVVDGDATQQQNNQENQSTSQNWTRTGIVVHGTFYSAWEKILQEGALKKMGRNHVHFSTGPAVQDVLRALHDEKNGVDGSHDTVEGATGAKEKGKRKQKGAGTRLARLMEQSKVVSGMRRDAEVLIYVNVKRSLQEENKEEGKMKWWKSENGVILTEGKGEDGLVGMEYWEKVVEVKEGLGVLWEDGEVKTELPERLRGRGMPMGKRGGRGSGGGRGTGDRRGRGRGGGENMAS